MRKETGGPRKTCPAFVLSRRSELKTCLWEVPLNVFSLKHLEFVMQYDERLEGKQRLRFDFSPEPSGLVRSSENNNNSKPAAVQTPDPEDQLG